MSAEGMIEWSTRAKARSGEFLVPEIADEEDCVCGTLVLYGIPHHIMGLRVVEQNGDLVPTRDPYNRLAEVEALYDYEYQTVQIPGLKGRWILWMHPHGA